MSATGSKIRIYELAKELKLDTKKVIEDLKREGVQVTVASNSISKELADKIRNKYFPTTPTPVSRTIKVIKKQKAAEESKQEAQELKAETSPFVIEEPAVAEEKTKVTAEKPAREEESVKKATVAEPELKQQPAQESKVAFRTVKVIRKVEIAKPQEEKKVIEEPSESRNKIEPEVTTKAEPVAEQPIVQDKKIDSKEQPSQPVAAKIVTPQHTEAEKKAVQRADETSGVTRIKQLKLRKEAIDSGLKEGERIVFTEAKKPKEEERPDRRRGKPGFKREERKPELRATPGETPTPKIVYFPQPGDRRPVGRHDKKAHCYHKDLREARADEREFVPAPPRTIEEKIFDQIGRPDPNKLKPLKLAEGTTVRDLAEKIGLSPKDLVQFLIKQGVFATINQNLSENDLKRVGKSLGFDISVVPFEEAIQEEDLLHVIETQEDALEVPRAPVVTVMGHVDHGKTSLLDAIRHTNVAEGEAGGITQHIGAYSVYVPDPDDPQQMRRIVFLDTPGHEAFTMMRARGARVTDIVILVVAADDGVMPQTIEAIEHARAAGVPIIVAINKIDKPDANIDKVKQQLAMQGLQPVDWGGDVEMIPVSAKKKQNLDLLLETVILQADIMELKANPALRAYGVVLEAKLDKGRGPVATVLVQQGTLKVGDPFIVGKTYGKVRAMFSDRGEGLKEAPPSTPVEVLGLEEVPQAGDIFQVVSDLEQAQTIARERQLKARTADLSRTLRRGIEALGQEEVKELLVVLKADVQGSVEVLRSTLEKLSTDKVKVRVIRAGVGAITESDVLLASAAQVDNKQTAVVIIGFNVRPESRAVETAKQENVEIRLHSIIYKVEEEIKAAMIGMLEAVEKEVILGKAKVQQTFKVPRVGTVAGCLVSDGVIKRASKARLIRDGVVIWEGELASLKRFKDDVNEVRSGFECGIGLLNFNDIKVGDEIESFTIEKVAATEL